MTKKKTKKTRKGIEKQGISPEHDYTQLWGVFSLSSALILFLSLISFAFDAPQENLIGVIGEKCGWLVHSIFGLSSYLLCGYLFWLGWRMCLQKSIHRHISKGLWFLLLVSSACFLLCLIEDRFSSTGAFLQSHLYPSLWLRKSRFHLGGAFFHYFYRDLPTFSLFRTLNTFGVALLFSTTLVTSILFLAKLPPSLLLQRLNCWLARREEELKAAAAASATNNAVGTAAGLLRYVRLKIPSGAAAIPGEIPNSRSGGHELLAIQPELNPKIRPSMSNKEAAGNDKEGAKDKKKEIETDRPAEAAPPPPSIAAPTQAPPLKSAKTLKRKEGVPAPQQLSDKSDFTNYQLPQSNLLTGPKKFDQSSLKKDLKRQAEVLEETLQSFGIEAKVGQINCGPTINSFEVHPAIGVKVQKIKALENDIALNMEAKSIRIIAPIPGKAAVGIEIPTPQPQEVAFKDLLQAYQQSSRKFHIPILLGKAVNGDYVMNDLTKMPHCIIAGATGSGKSVCINTIVMSILLTSKPDEIKLIMVDPKKVELTPYTNLPHMLAPVITEPQGAAAALQWLVKEMERRYEILKQTGARNIEAFNNRTIDPKAEEEGIPAKLYYIVCIVDELADLMMVSSSDIETPIARIAQMARAVGIHMILATQRPSREVITGIIKANFPTRIAFKVASRVNSQIILDETGAESLLGNGDMLFLPPGSSHLIRAQGAFIRDEDINAVTRFLSEQAPPNYKIASFDSMTKSEGLDGGMTSNPADSLYDQALEIVQTTGNASTTFLQRKLKIGYARAASLIDELEGNGIVGPADGAKPRKILKQNTPSKLSKECADVLEGVEDFFDE